MNYADYIKAALKSYAEQAPAGKNANSIHAAAELAKCGDDENQLRALVNYYLQYPQPVDAVDAKKAGAVLDKNDALCKALNEQLVLYREALKKIKPVVSAAEKVKTLNKYAQGLFISQVSAKKPSTKVRNAEEMEAMQLLKEARLTINFVTRQLFNNENIPDPKDVFIYKNKYERGAAKEHAGRLAKEKLLFAYQQVLNPILQQQQGPQDLKTVAPDPKAFDHKEAAFDPALRPKYGALDFLHAPNGAARGYGRSFLVLKDHVKQRCTYTAGDTGFKNFDTNQYATEKDFSNVIDLAGPILRQHLNAAKKAAIPDNYGVVISDYVEAQIHMELDLTRDVKEIHLDLKEIMREKIDPKLIKEFRKAMKQIGVAVILVVDPEMLDELETPPPTPQQPTG